MRTVFAVMLMLIFLGAVIFTGVAFFASRESHSAVHEIEGLIAVLIATVCVAAMFIGAGQDANIDELVRCQRATDSKPC